ncbi:hypothetical protein [Kribbella sp. VKM Ac-2566]|uniref:hypothetical protein n=1 Tax=Kribbella sp. VKM Ac-2566 TaxID=2512218 RepID=UPI0010624A1D|nr:hypothetical protein [Kribbella sp. VKM Ac-2566]
MTLSDDPATAVSAYHAHDQAAADWRTALTAYRDLVSKGWDEKTVHWRYADHQDRPSTGQCGVTSAWLMAVLREVHAVPAMYCYGDVWAVRESSEDLPDHCWLEVGDADDPDRLIVDLTCGQSSTFGEDEVLHASHSSIRSSHGVSYESVLRLGPAELDDDEVQDRLGRLVTALGPDHLPVMPERLRRFF